MPALPACNPFGDSCQPRHVSLYFFLPVYDPGKDAAIWGHISFCLSQPVYNLGRDVAVLTAYVRLLQIISGQHCSLSEIIRIFNAIRKRRVYCLIDGYCAF